MTKEKKGDKLNDFATSEEETDKRVTALEAQLGAVIKNLKQQTERVDALAELYSDISDKVGEVVEKTYPGDIANAIREIRDLLLKSKVTDVGVCPDETPTSSLDLSGIPHLDQLSIDSSGNVTVVRAKKFLGDLWGPINDAVKALGGKWVRDGQNSRWEIGGAVASKPPQSKETPQIKDPSAPATEKQLAFLEQLKVFVKPNLTKGEASKLIDNKLKEKKSGRN